MMTIDSDMICEADDCAAGLACSAWERCCAQTGRRFAPPRRVIPLKRQRAGRKSGVYRLEGACDDGSAAIAKRCLRESAAVERVVHERVLPRIGISTVAYYGYFEEDEGAFCWLFTGDAGETKLFETDCDSVARWLARLHGSAAALAGAMPLPQRGSAHYREHLCAAMAQVTQQTGMERGGLEVLRVLRELMEQLDAQWEQTCAPCRVAPQTLVHADFGRKNVRMRVSPTGEREVVALDWEMAGWGPPAVDIPHSPRRAPPRTPGSGAAKWRGTVSLATYAAHSCGRWDGAALDELARLARVGSVFRTVAGIRWALERLSAGRNETAMGELNWYAQDLPRTLAAIDWVKWR